MAAGRVSDTPELRFITILLTDEPQGALCAPTNTSAMATVRTPKPRQSPSPPHVRRTSYLVRRLEIDVRAMLDVALRPYGISTPHYLLLSLVSREGGLTSADLARRSSVTSQSMNESIAALVQKGLVRRTEDPNDRRVLLVSLSREGKRMLEACEKSVDAAESTFFARLTQTKLATLRTLLAALIDSRPS